MQGELADIYIGAAPLPHRSSAGGARPYCKKLADLGVLAKDTHEHSIRIAPPLVITADEVDWAVERFAEALC